MNDLARQLADRIDDASARVAIVGMGYVGFPLAIAVHEAGFSVLGFDVDVDKTAALKAGLSYLGHYADDAFQVLTQSSRFDASSDAETLAECDIVVLCVPTPLDDHGEPDLSAVVSSTEQVASAPRTGRLIVLESTTWPGTTREVMRPILERDGSVCGTDVFLAYSPERECPGVEGCSTAETPKVVGGIDDMASSLAGMFYGRVVRQIVPVSSVEVAEASKIVENVYRAVNIALVNELKVVFDGLRIDVWEVLKASATKPFGFQPFWPGPGLGGHCIPIDPFYLAWRARQSGHESRFIELAGEINSAMPAYVVSGVCDVLDEGSSVLVLGIAYKKNVSDIRETPAAPIIEMLQARGLEVSYHDPHCPSFPAMKRYDIDLSSVPLDAEHLSAADAVLIVTDHDAIDWSCVGRHATLIFDTRNAMDGIDITRGRVVKV